MNRAKDEGSDLPLGREPQGALAGGRAVVWLYGCTLFSSALLMFMVQPMFAKMALPKLGGTAAVWSLALVFFQIVLLLGYSYAHLMVRMLGLRTTVMAQVGTSLLALLSLPVSISPYWDMPPESGQALWLLALFASSVGLPFFALSANAPLLQSWFARAGQRRSADPYFLYAASNAGSFAALLAYPVAVEPFVGLSPQTQAWSMCFTALIVAIAACGIVAVRKQGCDTTATRRLEHEAPPVTGLDRLRWVIYSALPSGLLVAVTAYITTDVVAAPFLWVLPLAMYLLTFVIAFQTRPLITRAFLLSAIGLLGTSLAILAQMPLGLIYAVPLNLVLGFLLMLGSHSELAARRPHADQLTEFYFYVSLGGVLGGIFASLVAPNVFSSIVEYPLLVVATMAALGFAARGRAALSRLVWLGLAAAPMMIGLFWIAQKLDGSLAILAVVVWTIIVLSWLAIGRREPLSMALLLVGVIGSLSVATQGYGVLAQTRSFYGVLTVADVLDGRFHRLVHGTTAHGWQTFKNADGSAVTGRPQAEGYYYPFGPFGSAIEHLRKSSPEAGGRLDRVALVGMGIGSLLCYARPGENWDVYEIDPQVVTLAADTRFFTLLRDCGPPASISIGDGRLQLAHAADNSLDLIVLDAFSSDSIPAHLLTVDALEMYISKLKPGGIVVFHTSNRFMELSTVVEAASAALGLESWRNVHDKAVWKVDEEKGDVLPTVVVVAKTRGSIDSLAADPAWQRSSKEATQAWSDDYSSIPSAIWRKLTER